MADEMDAQGTDDSSSTSGSSTLLGLVILVVLLAGIGWGIVQLAPDDAPIKHDPTFVDSIFANVVVIAAARVLLLVAAIVGLLALIYIGASAVARLTKGHWLQRAGPFEASISEAQERVEEADDFLEDWMEATEENERLTEALEERDEAIRQLLADRERLIGALQAIQGEDEP